MRRNYNTLAQAFTFLLLFACSGDLQRGNEGHTRVLLRHPSFMVRRAPAGDLLFVAVSTTDPTSRGRFILSSGETSTWSVPNGDYFFHLVGYGGTGASSGAPVCSSAFGDDGGYGTAISLRGGEKSIRIDTTQGGCSLPPFGLGAALTTPLTVSLCNSTAALTSATAQKTCVDLTSGGQTASPVGKIRIGFHAQDEFLRTAIANVESSGTLGSGCVIYTRDGSALSALSDPAGYFPSGSADTSLALKLEIETYKTGNCAEADKLAIYTLSRGLAAVDGTTTSGSDEPAITKTVEGVTVDISDKAKFKITAGVPRLFILDTEAALGEVDSSASTVASNLTSVLADGTAVALITVTLTDADANPIAGKTVSIESSRGTLDTIATLSGTTGSNGQATFNVRSSTYGTSVFSATDTTDGLLLDATATVTFTSTDVVAPVPGTGISFSHTTGGAAISWSPATDNITAGSLLKFKLVRSSTNNIGSVSLAETNGTMVRNWTTGSLSFTGTFSSGIHFFNVLVKDAGGNKAAYPVGQVTIGDKKIFTVNVTSGNLGGTTGADSICQSSLPSGVTSAKALITTASRRACSTALCSGGVSENVDWVMHPNTRYVRTDGTTVIDVTNDSGVFPSNLDASVNAASGNVWTGLANDWTSHAQNCLQWASNSSGAFGMTGQASGTTINSVSTAGAIEAFPGSCSSPSNAIYCAEQ